MDSSETEKAMESPPSYGTQEPRNGSPEQPAPALQSQPPQYPSQNYQGEQDPNNPYEYHSPTVNPPAAKERAPDYLILTIITCLFFDVLCLGFLAFVCSVLSRSASDNGRLEDGRSLGNVAKKIAIAAIIVTIITVAVILTLYFTVYAVADEGSSTQ